MLDKLKEMVGNNWKMALLVAASVGVGFLAGDAAMVLGIVDGAVDQDLKAEICGPENPGEDK